MEWKNLTSKNIDLLDRQIPVVLPIGAIEQHGPHLPVVTDTLIGQYFCSKVDQMIPEDVLILPSVAVGCSRHHMDFAGTLTVSHDTFARYVTEILESVHAHGFQNLVLFNSHGGNQAIGQVIMETFGIQCPKANIALLTWWKIAGQALYEVTETGPGGVGHACEFETSLLQWMAEDLVDSSEIATGQNNQTFDWAEDDLLRSARAGLHRTMKERTTNGVFGDPTHASKQKGGQIVNIVLDAFKQILLDLRNQA